MHSIFSKLHLFLTNFCLAILKKMVYTIRVDAGVMEW